MNQQRLVITGWGSISPLGCKAKDIWTRYQSQETAIRLLGQDAESVYMAALDSDCESEISEIRTEAKHFRPLDKSALMALYAARLAAKQSKWSEHRKTSGVSIGSARGATANWEKFHLEFLNSRGKRLSPLASPYSTSGNIASWVAQDCAADSIAITHSMTCNSFSHALANGLAWLRAGMCQRFLVGGPEASLTAFSIAQMQALRLYASNTEDPYPCRPLDTHPTASRGLALGEAAAMFVLEPLRNSAAPALAEVLGLGVASEQIQNATSISADGQAFESAMRQALACAPRGTKIDVILAHAPGNPAGDEAELGAIKKVFADATPLISTNKHLLGHTFGASGALHLEYALLILEHQKLPALPYPNLGAERRTPSIRTIMINTAGFGGNAVSLIVGTRLD